jgi:hypothetical protein
VTTALPVEQSMTQPWGAWDANVVADLMADQPPSATASSGLPSAGFFSHSHEK